jgi:arginyl-tRNA synthetase
VEKNESDLVQNFFDSFSVSDPMTTPSSPAPERDDEFIGVLESSAYARYSRPHPPHSLMCDGKRFLQERGQETYFDKNIEAIEVRGEDGGTTRAASLAKSLCHFQAGLAKNQSGFEKMIHVTSHADSFKLQQALVLAEICAELCPKDTLPPSQHLVLCSGVEVWEDGVKVRDYPMAGLLQKRWRQMVEAFRIKYGPRANDAEVQSVITATTHAVVKFELLSTDPQSKIKLTVPPSGSSGRDVRFAGSFVLYNYARLSNLIRNFEKACKLGTYPPLPDIQLVDFSLLNDEEEWSIFFRYLLQYPLMVREVTSSVCDSHSIHCHSKLKKVCQFLTQLSHAVSSYYSRVKVLMAPEPHLVPLIHARLALVMAIKQTMHSALHLLAIDPPDQL